MDLEARRRLADHVRAVIDATVMTDVADADADKAGMFLDEAAALLRGASRDGDWSPDNYDISRPHDVLPWSMVIGVANPLAVPLRLTVGESGVVGKATFGWAYQGPPGRVHGAAMASAYDDLLGFASAAAGFAAMTGTLMIRYREATPLHREVTFEAAADRVEGRKVFVSARSLVDGDLTSEAEGIFIVRRPD